MNATRIAAVQMVSGPDIAQNLRDAERLVAEAAASLRPEVVGHLRISMIIAAALIEGLGFFALVVCLLLATKEAKEEAPAKHSMARPGAVGFEFPGRAC